MVKLKLPIVLTGLVIALVAGLFVVASFSGTHLTGTVRDQAVYRWDGGSIVVQRGKSSGSCIVTPDSAQEEDVFVRISRQNTRRSATELSPWFSGSATIKCRGSLTVWKGWTANLRLMTQNPLFFIVAALLAALPLIFMAFRRRQQTAS